MDEGGMRWVGVNSHWKFKTFDQYGSLCWKRQGMRWVMGDFWYGREVEKLTKYRLMLKLYLN